MLNIFIFHQSCDLKKKILVCRMLVKKMIDFLFFQYSASAKVQLNKLNLFRKKH